MVKIGVGKDNVVMTMDTKEKLLAIKHIVLIPKESIVSFFNHKVKTIMAFIQDGYACAKRVHGRDVFDQKEQDILLRQGFEYSKVFVEVDNKDAVAKELKKA